MPLRAAIYCRISKDDIDNDRPDDKGVSRQEREARQHVTRKKYKLVGVYVDNDLGASRQSRNRQRPDWDRLLRDIRSGQVQVVVARDQDRLTRRMTELEALVDLAEDTGVQWDLYRGHFDLTTANGRQTARLMGSIAAGESDRTAERLRSQRRDAAMRGKPVRGTPGFGWALDGQHVPDQAAAIREAATAVLAGASLASVARNWNAQGLSRRMSDKPWTASDIRVVLCNPRHVGRAVYQGKPVGSTGEEPILDLATFDALNAHFRNPARKRAPKRRGMLSGLLVCGGCGGRMHRASAGLAGRQLALYRCQPVALGGCRKVSISAGPVDRAIVGAVLQVLQHSSFDAPEPTRQRELSAELARLDEDSEQLGAAFGRGDVGATTFTAASRELEARRAALLAQITPTSRELVLESIDPATIGDEWDHLDPEGRRLIIAALIDRVTVLPVSQVTDRTTPVARLQVTWKG